MGGPDLEIGQAFEKKSPDYIRMPPLSYQASMAQSVASHSEISLKDRAETEREDGDAARTRFCSCDPLLCILFTVFIAMTIASVILLSVVLKG
ncbi:hypothetical protein ATEIFO6365_0001060700 [Aspergillus terreus]|uniref:Uncharacterized protein n=1 Tax=Aspergillus terreus TaxID=33178 RepID=A0A5M3YLT6_ASPTE|nr:hypothetical protein ATETN484_0001052800 [Aspergillus terreus]GFF12384.1 hypothetical protein ATEIFO6365_0001060700 [Aspergillus terreus]